MTIYFFTILEAGSPRSKSQQVQILRSPLWLIVGHFLTVSSPGVSSVDFPRWRGRERERERNMNLGVSAFSFRTPFLLDHSSTLKDLINSKHYLQTLSLQIVFGDSTWRWEGYNSVLNTRPTNFHVISGSLQLAQPPWARRHPCVFCDAPVLEMVYWLSLQTSVWLTSHGLHLC